MSKCRVQVHCPNCNRYVYPTPHPGELDSLVLRCPQCQTSIPSRNPDGPSAFGVTLALRLLGVVARLIKKSGVMERLQEEAENSPAVLDDLAYKVVRNLVEAAAAL